MNKTVLIVGKIDETQDKMISVLKEKGFNCVVVKDSEELENKWLLIKENLISIIFRITSSSFDMSELENFLLQLVSLAKVDYEKMNSLTYVVFSKNVTVHELTKRLLCFEANLQKVIIPETQNINAKILIDDYILGGVFLSDENNETSDKIDSQKNQIKQSVDNLNNVSENKQTIIGQQVDENIDKQAKSGVSYDKIKPIDQNNMNEKQKFSFFNKLRSKILKNDDNEKQNIQQDSKQIQLQSKESKESIDNVNNVQQHIDNTESVRPAIDFIDEYDFLDKKSETENIKDKLDNQKFEEDKYVKEIGKYHEDSQTSSLGISRQKVDRQSEAKNDISGYNITDNINKLDGSKPNNVDETSKIDKEDKIKHSKEDKQEFIGFSKKQNKFLDLVMEAAEQGMSEQNNSGNKIGVDGTKIDENNKESQKSVKQRDTSKILKNLKQLGEKQSDIKKITTQKNEPLNIRDSATIFVTGLRNSGVTSFVYNLATLLESLGKRVVAIDLDIDYKGFNLYFKKFYSDSMYNNEINESLIKAVTYTNNYLEYLCDITDRLYVISLGYSVESYGLEDTIANNIGALIAMLKMSYFDYIIIDIPLQYVSTFWDVITASDFGILIAENNFRYFYGLMSQLSLTFIDDKTYSRFFIFLDKIKFLFNKFDEHTKLPNNKIFDESVFSKEFYDMIKSIAVNYNVELLGRIPYIKGYSSIQNTFKKSWDLKQIKDIYMQIIQKF